MKQKVTSEKIKKFNENSMFNVKNVCLMKKQVFTFMFILALMMFAGIKAHAQAVGTGLAPTTAYWAIVGSQTTHTITIDGSTTAWDVRIIAIPAAPNEDDAIGDVGAAATSGTHYFFTSGGGAGDNTVTIRWLATAGAGNLYGVRMIETSDDGTCTTVRMSYVGVFDFDVDVYLATDISGAGEDGDTDPIEYLSSWCDDVVDNAYDEADIAGVDQAIVNNAVALENKETSIFFRVRITLTGNPTGFDLQNMKWRIHYTLQDQQNVSLYDITSADAGAAFGAQSTDGGTAFIGQVADAELDVTAGTNGWIYFDPLAAAANSAVYDFEIGNHNRLGSINTEYSIRVDEADIEFTTAVGNTDYNNGTKWHTDVTPANEASLDDGQTGVAYIEHGPASTVITITD